MKTNDKRNEMEEKVSAVNQKAGEMSASDLQQVTGGYFGSMYAEDNQFSCPKHDHGTHNPEPCSYSWYLQCQFDCYGCTRPASHED